MAAKRNGLGRGLDSLIPNRSGGKGSSDGSKSSSGKSGSGKADSSKNSSKKAEEEKSASKKKKSKNAETAVSGKESAKGKAKNAGKYAEKESAAKAKTSEPVKAKPVSGKTTAEKPAAKPAAARTASPKPAVKPAAARSAATKPAAPRSATGKPSAEASASAKPAAPKAASAKPAAEKPAEVKPAVSKTASAVPATAMSANEKPVEKPAVAMPSETKAAEEKPEGLLTALVRPEEIELAAPESAADTGITAGAAAEKPEEKPEEKLAERPAEKSEEKPAGNAAERPGGINNVSDQVVMLRISKVEPNREQPRKVFDEDKLKELAESIKQFGVIQPLLVQKNDSYYEIIAGERRWRAAKLAGLREIPVIIREYSEQQAVEVSLIENIQREDLNPIEEARAYQRLMEEFHLRQEDIAERVSRSRAAVTNSIRLLRLPEDVREMLANEEITEGHARAILGLSDAASQIEAARAVAQKGLSVRDTEKLVRELLRGGKPGRKSSRSAADDETELIFRDLEERLKSALSTKVTIQRRRNKSGRIEIEYYSQAELERLLDTLCAAGRGEEMTGR